MADEVRDRWIFRGGRLLPASLAVAVLGLATFALGLFLSPERTWFSYLMAFTFTASIAVGGLLFLMIGYAVNARWASVIRRLTEMIALAVVPLALLFIPIPFGLAELYPWKDPPPTTPAHILELFEHRSAFLNTGFFTVRGVFYFLIWIAVVLVLRGWSLRRDRRPRRIVPDPEAALGRERVFASVLLPLVALSLTFAAFDWLMSLESRWFSTIFGVYYFAGGFLSALSVLTILAYLARKSGRLDVEITPSHFHALGRLLLAFTVFWAYCAFFQAMLIAIANKPEEVVFYLKRTHESWMAFVYILMFGHFAIPFLLLLPKRFKFRPRTMAFIAGWLILMHFCDVYWLVIPVAAPEGFRPHWADLAALALVLGTTIAFVAWRQRGIALLAEHDPFLEEGLEYRSPL